MSMRESELGLRKTGDPRDTAYADVIAGILKARGKDVPLPPFTQTISRKPSASQQPPQESIVQPVITSELPQTPDATTTTFASIWQERSQRLQNAGIDRDLTFVPCPYSQEELDKLKANGKRVGYVPPELATQEQRHILGIMFPQMHSYSVKEGNLIKNEVYRSGWFDYEVAIDTPYLNTTEQSLREVIEGEGRQGMNITEYIIAAQDGKVLTGKYLDETNTWSRLLCSRLGNRVVRAYFDGDGRLYISSDLHPQNHSSYWGGRSIGLPLAA